MTGQAIQGRPAKLVGSFATATTAVPSPQFFGTTSTSVEPDVYDELIRAVTVLAMAMRAWKETL